ncbi:MAG: hypothetical protein ACP5IC_02605, partial [Minisyncoccia bacterium]
MKNKIFISLLFLTLFVINIPIGSTQTPDNNVDLIITWSAYNFYPSNYLGHPLATQYTPIKLGLIAVQNNKIVDLSRNQIIWRINSAVVGNDLGLTIINYQNNNSNDQLLIEASVMINNQVYAKNIIIPINSPSIVITNPAIDDNNDIYGGQSYVINAIPYFFNIQSIDDLQFTWYVNNQFATDANKNVLNLEVGIPSDPVNNVISVKLYTRNKNAITESTKNTIYFTVLSP